MLGAKKPIEDKGLRIPERLLNAWRQTAIECGRCPGHAKEKGMEAGALFLLRQEKEGIRSLWEIFTQDRTRVGRYLQDPKKQAMAYLMGFHLSNVARTLGVLNRLASRHELQESFAKFKNIHVTDLGCGTGAISAAFVSFLEQEKLLQDRKLTVELVDQTKAFVTIASTHLQNQLADVASASVRPRQQELSLFVKQDRVSDEHASDTLQVILCGNIWNELYNQKKTEQLVTKWIEKKLQSKSPVLLLLLEPANQDLSRKTMALRDHLTASGFSAHYPCLHSESCAMLERKRDWCYSEIEWALPKEGRYLDKMLKLNHNTVHTTAFVLASPGTLQAKKLDKNKVTIVGRPIRSQFRTHRPKVDVLLCCQDRVLRKQLAAKDQLYFRGDLIALTKEAPINKPREKE